MYRSPSPPRRRQPFWTLETFDAGYRRRLTIAVLVSVAFNAVVFGGAGLLAHQFLKSLTISSSRPSLPSKISVTRLVLPPGVLPGQVPHEKLAALVAEERAKTEATPAPSPIPSPSSSQKPTKP